MNPAIITLLGDSISAGYGLQPGEALPVRLHAALAARGVAAEVIGAGVSGDAVRDGLARLERDVPMRSDLCVVALGANDMMQSVRPERMHEDLAKLIDTLLARPTRVLLCGMRAPPWIGAYARAFDAVFPEVARTRGVPFVPFLLDGVALDPRFNLRDRMHPNARGIDRIAQTLAPAVIKALGPARAPRLA